MYIAERVGRALAEAEGDRGRGRREQQVEALVRGGEVAGDQRPHPLSATVVGLVEPGRERVGPQHDPALHLRPEAGGAGALVHHVELVGLLPAAEAHAVVTGEVRGRLRRREHVVGRDPVARVGQLGVGDVGAQLLAEGEGPLEHLAHPRLDPLGIGGELPRHPDPEAAQVLARRHRHAALDAGRGRVAGIAPDHRAEQQGRVGHVTGERPALVERRGEGDHPRAGDRSVGGLEPDDAAERRRLADRAAGVGADRTRSQASRHGGGRSAGGPARDAIEVPGVADVAVGGVLVRRAHRELVHVGLAEDPGAAVEQPLDRGRRVGRDVALEDPRAGGRREAVDAEDVLDRDRHAGERAGAGRRGRVIGVGAPQIGAEVVVGAGVGVEPLRSRQPALVDLGEGLRDAEIDRFAHA